MRAVITVVGKDRPGILSFVANQCATQDANVIDVTQKTLQDLFTMIMIVDYNDEKTPFIDFVQTFEEEGEKRGVKIHVMHEDIFTAMHVL